MSGEEVLSQLDDLRRDRESFLGGDGDDIIRKDIAALDAAIDIIKSVLYGNEKEHIDMKEFDNIKIQHDLKDATHTELALRIDRAISFVERWGRQLAKEPGNTSLRNALREIEAALLDIDNEPGKYDK